jgi:hypothetical protein
MCLFVFVEKAGRGYFRWNVVCLTLFASLWLFTGSKISEASSEPKN